MTQEDLVPPYDVPALLQPQHDEVNRLGSSRWQTNYQHYRGLIAHGVHRGSRPERSTPLCPEDLTCSIGLSARGYDSKCAAYRGLSSLLNAVLEHGANRSRVIPGGHTATVVQRED